MAQLYRIPTGQPVNRLINEWKNVYATIQGVKMKTSKKDNRIKFALRQRHWITKTAKKRKRNNIPSYKIRNRNESVSFLRIYAMRRPSNTFEEAFFVVITMNTNKFSDTWIVSHRWRRLHFAFGDRMQVHQHKLPAQHQPLVQREDGKKLRV